MKLMCKLFGHKWVYYELHKRCKWCDERVWFIKDIELLKGLKKLKKHSEHSVYHAKNYLSTAQTLTSQRTCSGRNDDRIKKT
ncbi:hypothetical protein HPC60_03350 [Lactococcus lactis subsp. lactis]|nr:hypothetical protein HPC60_03350 [Lactococcus lactis subsp. lactis]